MQLTRLHPQLRSAIVFGLALALWFVSTLGLVHGTLHGHGTLPAMELQADAPADGHAAHGAGKLFHDHADGDSQCRLYDQRSGGNALPGLPPLVLPIALPTASFHFFPGEALARRVALQ